MKNIILLTIALMFAACGTSTESTVEPKIDTTSVYVDTTETVDAATTETAVTTVTVK